MEVKRKMTTYGVSVERQAEGSKIEAEIYHVYKHIAVDLVNIWELWDLEEGGYEYYFDISVGEQMIKFMQRGCMGDSPSYADWLFKDKSKWIHDTVHLTEENIADPESFLSKHRGYRQEYEKYLHELKVEIDHKEKEKHKVEFDKLKKEFGTNDT